MKSMLNQQAMQGQQLQAGQLENQQRQMDVDSQKALQRAYTEAQGDPDKTTQLAAKYGAKPTALLEWQKSVTAQKLQALDLVSKQGDLAKTNADLMQGAHDTVTAAAPADRPAVYQQQLAGLQARKVDTSSMPQQYPGDDQFQTIGVGLKSHTQFVEDALKTAGMGKDNAQAADANASAAEHNQAAEWYKNHPGAGAPGVPAETVSMAGYMNTPAAPGEPMHDPQHFPAWKAQQEAIATAPQKIAVATAEGQARANIQSGGFGQPGDPMVDMVGQGRVDLATALQRVPPAQKDQFMGQLSQKYPDFNQGTFGIAKHSTEAFTSGSQGQQLTAIDTARQHMATFKQTADALDNGDFLMANKAGNYLGMQFGSDKATNFNIARSAFAGEVGKAFAGANVGVSDRQELMDKINAASSPAQLKGYADTADKLLEGKQTALKRSYDSSQQAKPNFGGQSTGQPSLGATKSYQGHTYTQQQDGSWKLTQ